MKYLIAVLMVVACSAQAGPKKAQGNLETPAWETPDSVASVGQMLAEELNKKSPQMLDEWTRLDGAQWYRDTLIADHTMSGEMVSLFTPVVVEEFESTSQAEYCTKESMSLFRKWKMPLLRRYYQDGAAEPVFTVYMAMSECK